MRSWRIEGCDASGLDRALLEAALNGETRRYALLARRSQYRGDVAVLAGASALPLWPSDSTPENDAPDHADTNLLS